MKNKKKISSFCITIDDCDYVYDYNKHSFLSYCCDCPVDFPCELAKILEYFGDDINNCIDKGIFNF